MRTTCSQLKNKTMNNEVYLLRRRVLNQIYLLKRFVNLPRITVRITEDHHELIGMGTMDHNVTIWITEKACKFDDKNLLHLVAHEIGHAVYKKTHNDSCPLMKQGLTIEKPANLETIVKVLKSFE